MTKTIKIFTVALLALFPCLHAKSAVPPKPAKQSFVFDYAGMLNEQERSTLRETAQALNRETGVELTLVTVDNLQDVSLEEFAHELFVNWGIGDAKKNDGLLLLAVKSRVISGKPGKVRIEVGYGLEGIFNDAKCGRILDKYAIPAWKQKEYARGLTDTFSVLAQSISGDYVDGAPRRQPSAKKEAPLWSYILMLFLFFSFPFSFRLFSKHFRSFDGKFFRGGGFGGGGFGGGGFGGFGGGSSGGGGASR